ncbi:cellobiose transport system substrate-binding protein [Kribbella aluminosa]|uniref:Cellobiose transport system substrate-binding protein n=1 Tax=Kribbella aluminosa TaxID=416017 RepID=A0ABS4UTQ0_9ACTN|nr:ABC transporter substrate-binding protein [Kribbella aluminosa]MBP2354991.1 cellobiose transport system substrate-binding protein [Kribbella aluminosa]
MTRSPASRPLSRRALLGGAAALGAAAATGGLSGCGSPASLSADPSELVLWYWNRAVTPELLAQAAEHIPGSPGRRVRGDLIGAGFDTKLRTSLAGDAYIPNITLINSNCALYFPNESLFLDFSELGAAQYRDLYYPWKLKLGTTPSGRLCFWPLDTGPTGFYYRADLFDKAGLPSAPDKVSAAIRTWDQWIELGRELRANGGPAMVNSAAVVFGQFINASPERYFDEQDRPIFAAEGSAVRRAWDTAVKAVDAGITGNQQTATGQNSAWVTGATAGHIEAVWWAEILGDTAPKTKGLWRIADQPVAPGNSGGSFVAIPRSCKDPEAAFNFTTWLTSPANQAVAFNKIQLFPSSPASFERGGLRADATFFGSQNMLRFFSDAARRVPSTFVSTYESQVEAFAAELANVESGGKAPEQAWEDAVAQVNRVLKKRGVI